MRSSQVILLVSMLLLSGCASGKSVIHPITNKDIYRMDNGDYCFSPFYLNEILQVKVQ